MDIKKILANRKSFRELAGGGHPASFLARNKMSFSDHFKAIEGNENYRQAFYQAITASLGAWHAIADKTMLNKNSTSPTSYHKGAAVVMEKFESKLWIERIKDIERFIPELANLEKYSMAQDFVNELTIYFESPINKDEKINKDKEYLKNEGKLSDRIP